MDWNALNLDEQRSLSAILASTCRVGEINAAIGGCFRPADSLATLVSKHAELPAEQRFHAQLIDLVRLGVEKGRLNAFVGKVRQIKHGYVTFRNLAQLMAVGSSTVSVSRIGGFELQGAANQLGMVDFAALLRRLGEITEATCRFVRTVGGRKESIGSGILVGEDLVLTNYHLNLIRSDLTGGTTPDPAVSCEFDYAGNEPGASVSISTHEGWLVAFSPDDAGAQAAGKAPSSIERLDYALIKLAKPAPLAGGIARAFETPVKINASNDGLPIMVVHYPEQESLSVSFGKTVRAQEGNTRVRYDADTSKGTSGSGVYLLPTCSWIALHQGGDQVAGYNQGIPVGFILEHRLSQRR
ncbi:S1 family peptidase [Rhizobium leguminosarum]